MINATLFILIGGKSNRFGSPKWEAVIDGNSVLDRLWNECSNFEHRFVVGKENPGNLNKQFIYDDLELQAPITGLYTSLKHTKTDWSFLLSCDLPLMNANIVNALWDARTESVDAVVPHANNRIQGTCAFYNKCILSQVELAINCSEYSLYSIADKLNSIKIEFGNDKRFWNMNTKKDYEKILQYITEQD